MIGVFPMAIPDAGDILLSEGVVYINHGEAGEAVIGATRGGSKLQIEKPIKVVAYDGAYGETENMRRTEMYIIRLVINFLKINYTTLAYGTAMDVSDGSDADGTYKKMTFRLDFQDTDVLTNVAFIGQKLTGEATFIKVLNALNISPISLEFKAKDEVKAEMTYTGFYTAANPTIPPLEIWDYVA